MSLTQAMFAALNIAYEEEERRSFLRFYLSAFTFALAGIIGGVVMLLAIVYVPILFAYAGYSHGFEQIIAIARWPLLALLVLSLLAALYRFGPCRRRPKWSWVSVGSLFSTTLWLIASAGFSYYVSHFAQYDKIYGSLGAVIVLLFWLYLTLLHHPARRRDQRRARAADGAGHDDAGSRGREASVAPSSPITWREDRAATGAR